MGRSELTRYAEENGEMLARVLACGEPEAQGYALALLAQAEPDPEAIGEIQDRLEEIKLEAAR